MATKTGEGFDKANASQELPIDINYRKLNEWLVNRQKIPKDWHKVVQSIQLKASEVEKEVSPNILKSLSGGIGAQLDYYRAVEIRDKLAEGSQRTLFGSLSGAAAIWDRIVKAYEKNYVFLGESGQSLIRSADYDIPFLRKSIAACHDTLAEQERRAAESRRAAAACAEAYKQECERLGISGTDVSRLRSELAGLATQLPSILAGVERMLCSSAIGNAIDHYTEFTNAVSGFTGDESVARTGEASCSSQLLTSVVALRKGTVQAPAVGSAAITIMSDLAGMAECTAPEVDWDIGVLDNDGSAAAGAEPEISWDLDLGSALQPGPDLPQAEELPVVDFELETVSGEEGVVEIAWDIGVTEAGVEASTNADEVHASSSNRDNTTLDSLAEENPTTLSSSLGTEAETRPSDEAAEINWDIVIDPGVGESAAPEEGAVGAQEGSGVAGVESVPHGVRADEFSPAVMRLAADAEFRASVLDDLQELRAFLTSRLRELSGSSAAFVAAVLPPELSSVDAGLLNLWSEAVTEIINAMATPRLRQLLLLSTSKSYMDRLVAGLQRRSGQEARLLAAAKDADDRRAEARVSLAALAPRLGGAVARARHVKGHVESVVSGLLGGRAVNLLGDINTIISQSA